MVRGTLFGKFRPSRPICTSAHDEPLDLIARLIRSDGFETGCRVESRAETHLDVSFGA